MSDLDSFEGCVVCQIPLYCATAPVLTLASTAQYVFPVKLMRLGACAVDSAPCSLTLAWPRGRGIYRV